MKSELDKAYSWLVDTISYENLGISITLLEMVKSGSSSTKEEGAPVEGAHLVYFPGKAQKLKIKFDLVYTFQVVNESCDSGDSSLKLSSDGFLSVVSESDYLNYLREKFSWYEEINGKANLYRLWSENEILEIYSPCSPEIESQHLERT